MQRALIVDDSKTAQTRLRKMLSSYELTVDMALSAEQALGYLSYNHPDIVFMDHHMEGMDGLEALKIIKGNPSTATIPVVMYTAEKGDVYVDQARALGALDILSKEIIRPANLEELMEKLKINPVADTTNTSDTAKAEGETAPEVEPPLVTKQTRPKPPRVSSRAASRAATPSRRDEPGLTPSEVSSQVARLFELHISDVRQHIENSSRMIVRNLRSEIGKASKKQDAESADVDEVNADALARLDVPPQSRTSVMPVMLLLATLCGLGYLVYENRQVHSDIQALTKQIDVLASNNSEQRAQIIRSLPTIAAKTEIVPPPASAGSGQSDGFHDIISWAVAYDFSFSYGEEPLSVGQVDKIEEFVSLLFDAGYEGVVDIGIHFANYCLSQDDSSEWVLAPPETTVQECVFLEDISDEYAVEDYLSLAYVNFERYTAAEFNDDIQVNISSARVASEVGIFDAETAGEWNTAISKESRLVVDL